MERAPSSAASRTTAPVIDPQRLRQILWSLGAALLVSAIVSGSRGVYLNTTVQLGALGVLGLAYYDNQRANTARAAALMLGTVVVALFGLVLVNEGLFDEAVVALPGVLVFAGMLGLRRVFVGLLVAMCLLLVGTYALNTTGLLHTAPDPLGPGRVVVLMAILMVTAFFVWMLTSDWRQAMQHMEENQERLLESHARIETLAQRDPLTSLPNRTLARDRLEQYLARGRRLQCLTAVLYLDLDDFKTVNDSLGHAAGDALLCQVAQRLQQPLRDSDTVARLSGDEFLLVLGELADEEAAAAAAAKVLQLLAQPFALHGVELQTSASVGVAMAPRDGDSVEVLLKHADLAMYRAKDSGRNAFRFFDPAMNEAVVEHLHMAAGLRAAMRNGELMVYYQPQIDLHSGAVVGAEALLRWLHPQQGFIPPQRFISVAERSGLINEVGRWVLQRACEDAKWWQGQGLVNLSVAVNVSPVQFRRDDMEHEVAQALESSGLAPEHLELELTESLLVADANHVGALLQRLRARGVQFAIDDFGTGYSNLGYLQRFCVHRLKIDRSFVRSMAHSAHDDGIVRAIIEMAHCLQLQVVAEGVEDEATCARLRGYGCETAQGYAWAAALEKQAFVDYVHHHHAKGVVPSSGV